MFILTTFSDLVQIPPYQFYKKNYEELEDKINEKYANKVVPKVGLCICLYDILKASDGLIGHGTGNANVNVEFRLIVFRPFKGEIIDGIVKRCTPNGIQIHTEFFTDIYVPSTMLFDSTRYEAAEGVWAWHPSDEAGDIWFDPGTTVRLRVEREVWNTNISGGVDGMVGTTGEGMVNGRVNGAMVNGVGEGDADAKARERAVYTIEASMAEPGLGGVEWW